METPQICPKCNKTSHVSKNGRRYNKFSIKQRYYCAYDNAWFTPDDGFSRMRFDPKIIMVAIDLFNKKLTLRSIKQHLLAFYHIDVSHITIRNWAIKYGKGKGQNLNSIDSYVNTPEMELFGAVRYIKKNREEMKI
jgi:transposase-like protein|tara:strand:+ start:57 stop:464 length:408 start_codon:yes stop_codon:yes gene_type:complete